MLCNMGTQPIVNFFCSFIYLFAHSLWASLGPRCFAPTLYSLSEQGMDTPRWSMWLLIARGFSCCRAQALATRTSVVAAQSLCSYSSQILKYRLRSCGTWLSCSMESSWTRDLTRDVLCISRLIPIHCATRGLQANTL